MSTEDAAVAVEPAVAQRPANELVVAEAPEVKARELGRERGLAMLLRAGGVLGGACFLASIPLQYLPPSAHTDVLADLLRKAGASFLIVTPIARLGVAGVMLALRGEWRYLAYAAGTLSLLALAVGARMAA